MGHLQQRFGSLVAAHRRRVGWTQKRLAEVSELSDDMVARIEVGSTGVSFATVEKLASALEIDPAELFTTDIPAGAFQKMPASRLAARLAGLSSDEVLWLSGIVDAALKPKR